jgi:uncharacterized membrane protein
MIKTFRHKIALILLIFSFFGFLDATYLTIKHFNGSSLICNITSGCNTVLSSSYSEVFGIPVALGGAFYYLIIFILVIAFLDTKKDKILNLVSKLTIAGLFASIYFVYLQVIVLKSICQYCMLSAITSSLLFITGMVYLYKNRKKD